MILPVLQGVSGLRVTPMTWTLVALNVSTFILLQAQVLLYDQQMEPYFQDEFFITHQGLVYAHYLLQDSGRSPSSILEHKATQSLKGDIAAQNFLGRRVAFHDRNFLRDFARKDLIGDQVLLGAWRDSALSFHQLRYAHPTYNMGYHSQSPTWSLSLLTYQFAHSGWMHLLFNMFFLLVFGKMVEPRLGPAKFLLFYLLGGIFAALTFVAVGGGASTLPLVGASGAIGGLIGLTLAFEGKKPARFFYYLGVLRMPFWMWAVYFWVLTDLTGWWKMLPELGSGVAHSAHLGGTAAGLILGLMLRPFYKVSNSF